MDLKIPSLAANPGLASAPIGDLLSQLRAAGTLEAEVVRLLQDNQLLLTSRLGQIRTSNRLDYRVGDRIELRLDESSGQAVLKTSRAESKPIIIDTRQHPELDRALPPDRPLLARVVRLLSRQADIRLADQVARIARAPDFKSGQLLSLERRDSDRWIEIRPLQTWAVYKAMVKQLLPAVAQQRTPALVSLLNLAGTAHTAKASLPLQPAAAGNAGKPPYSARTAAAGLATSVARAPASVHPPIRGGDTAAGPGYVPRTGRSGAARGIAAGHSGGTILRAAGAGAAAAAPVAVTRPAGTESRGIPTRVSAASVILGAKSAGPASSSWAPASAAAAADKPVATSVARESMAGAAAAVPSKPPAGVTREMPAAGAAAVPAVAHAALKASTLPTLPSLEPLLQLVRRLADIDAPQIRKWFELARLVRATTEVPHGTAAADLLRLLRPLGESENLGRELAQALSQKTAVRADADSSGARASQSEVPQALLRDGLRLVEQSLTQNLLQRASLGLQQETQQPLNLSLALPFIDQQQIRPLTIDLRQRGQAAGSDRRSWEVRLSFELGDLGCISCHLLLEGVSVAASFYSEREPTRHRIEAELPQLRRQLQCAGFEPGEFHSFAGRPAAPPTPAADDFPESLIDIEA